MELISDIYRDQQAELHQTRSDYGSASGHLAPTVSELINNNGFTQILDYGAGKGRLVNALQVNHQANIRCYDPAVPQFARPPEPAEFVVCLDVLEHIEPEYIDAVLDHLKALMLKLGFFTIHSGPAGKNLPDGRNAHLIQKPTEWWLPKIVARFELDHLLRTDNRFVVLVTPKA